jgi:uncharacterized SAM-dependent methyltransferase
LNTLFLFLSGYFEEFDFINLIEIGPGNCKSSIPIIQNLYESKKLGKYVAVDINDRMNQIAKKNFINHFPEEYFASHVLDIEISSLQDILFSYKESQYGDKKILNLILLMGYTIGNFDSQAKVLQDIKEGMFPGDLLIIDSDFDNPVERSLFITLGKKIRDRHALYVINLLGLDDSHYERETVYNVDNSSKEYNLIIKQPIKINFRNNRFVILEEGQKLNVWKNKQDTFESVARKMKNAYLNLQYIAKHPKESKLIYVAKV